MRAVVAPVLFAALALIGCSREQPQPTAAPAGAPTAAATPAPAPASFNVAWSHYTGWEPWGYAAHAGILAKWADKYGIKIELTLVNDYIESINLYTAGKFDACVMTNMDALTIPAVGGVDSEAIIIGDYSNGNDGIVMKNGASVADLKGRSINLVELSVSHYLLIRALDQNGMTERDVTLVNTSDADIASVFTADPNGAAVTWNPPLLQARKAPGANLVFDSSKIPGEILDLMVVRTAAPDSLKKALTGAWYETMTILTTPGPARDAALQWMAASSGGSVEEFEAQLLTTAMYYTPAEAATFARSADVKATMERVRRFSFDKGLFGQGVASPDVVGIAFPDGAVQGSPDNVKLRFTAQWMQAAADGTL
jgi:NitT/TauT family transport system substrate-binding protein